MIGHSHDLVWSLVSVGITVGGPVLFVAGFRALRVRQLLEGTPTARVRSMAMGLVELQGRIEPRSRVSAPFSGRPCAFWEVEIATRSSNSRNGLRSWSTVHRNRSGHPFYLRDETGVALVYPQGADVRMPCAVQEETGGLGVPDLYMEYMKAQGLGMRQIWALGPMRFRERTLDEGVCVFVLGRAFPRANSVAISWDESSLQATGTDAAAAHVQTLDGEVRGVIRRGPHDPAFLISEQSEKTAALEFGLKAFGGIVGGPLLTVFGVWCLLEMARSGQLFH